MKLDGIELLQGRKDRKWMMKKLIVRTFPETWTMRSVYLIASAKRRRAYKRFPSRIIPHRVHIPLATLPFPSLPAHVIELRAPTAITMLLGTTVLLILGRRVTSVPLSLSPVPTSFATSIAFSFPTFAHIRLVCILTPGHVTDPKLSARGCGSRIAFSVHASRSQPRVIT